MKSTMLAYIKDDTMSIEINKRKSYNRILHRKCCNYLMWLIVMLILLMPCIKATEHQNTLADDIENAENDDMSSQVHLRQKRLIWITTDGRLALPPGTTLTITPTIGLPLVRHPPEGYFSNMSISFPVTIDFDKLGLTDNENPLGDFSPFFARSFSHEAGRLVGNYVAQYLHYRRKRDVNDALGGGGYSKPSTTMPQLPDRFKHAFHGGERIILYTIVEDLLSNFGLDGKACLLRTICEAHSRDLSNFGVIGEIAKLFLTVTKSPFSDQVPEYVRAQEIGEGRVPPQECFPFYKDCPKSIFKTLQNQKYTKQSVKNDLQSQKSPEPIKTIKNNEITYFEAM